MSSLAGGVPGGVGHRRTSISSFSSLIGMSDGIDGDGGETGGISVAMYLMARGLS